MIVSMKHIINRTLPLALALCAAASLNAQSYYDDIYFNPDKDKDKNIEAAKKAAEQRKNAPARTNGYILYPVEDYPAADTYTVTGGGVNRSVDEYNRRGVFGRPDSASITASDTLTALPD